MQQDNLLNLLIDPQTATEEELLEEIKRYKSIQEEYFNIEQSIKIYINSVYGATGSPFFKYYNVNIAEAVTLQGQDLAKYGSLSIDEYFHEHWHLDKELHKKLGLSYVNKVSKETATIYQDTDSVYVSFAPLINSCDYKGDKTDFILTVYKHSLKPFIEEKYRQYAESYNTVNLQNLELEKISRTAIMVAKKKYVLDLAWKDPGIKFAEQEKVKYVGIEIVQGSTPKYARRVLKDLVRMVLKHGKSLNYADVIKILKNIKSEYILQNPEDIGKTQEIGDYEKYCIEDKKRVLLAPKCPQNVRSAAIYNNIVYNNKKLKTKYTILKTGDKVKFYYTKDENEVFGFVPGNYPYEFAPKVDYDMQFEKTIIEPFNRIMIAIGFNPIPGMLIYAKSLF